MKQRYNISNTLKTLIEEFDLTQTFIPVGAVEWDKPNPRWKL